MSIETIVQKRCDRRGATMSTAALEINLATPVTATPAVVGLGAAIFGAFGIGFAVGQAAGR